MPPASAPEDVDVILYGATGYTGRLIAERLDAQARDAGITYAIAGRDTQRLALLQEALPMRPDAVTVALDDATGLERMARRAKVVLSAAGPFTTMGPPIMDAAMQAGTHFLDITGEQGYLRWAYSQDARARDAGVTVVNAIGFDVVPSDIAALLATTAMREVRRIDLCIASDAPLSGGTRRSMAAGGPRGSWYDHGRYRVGPPGRFVRTFRFPGPLGERSGVFVPWGDVVTAPRSTGAQVVRTFFATRPRTARRLHRIWPLTLAIGRIPLVRRIMARGAPASGEGPDAERRAASRFTILAEATDADGLVQRGLTRGHDPYGLTGASAAHAAKLLSRHDAPRGVLTPTQAFTFGPFCEALRPFGLEWRMRSVDS